MGKDWLAILLLRFKRYGPIGFGIAVAYTVMAFSISYFTGNLVTVTLDLRQALEPTIGDPNLRMLHMLGIAIAILFVGWLAEKMPGWARNRS